MSVIVQFTIFPTDKGASVSEYVSKAIAVVRDSGYCYQLTPMCTIVETETLEQAFALVSQANQAIEPHAERVYLTMSVDIRKGESNRMAQKIASVEQKIGSVNR